MKLDTAILSAILLLTAALTAGTARQLVASPSSQGGQAGAYGVSPGFPGAATPSNNVSGSAPSPAGSGQAGGYGGGYGGPGGSGNTNGVNPPSAVCSDPGPCYNKTLTCPAKCFESWSSSGKNFGSGGGGGGCTMDCNKCVAYC